MFRGVTTVLTLAFTVVTALEPFDNFREGSCFQQPRQIEIDRDFIDSLRYISAGSRYNFYSMSALMPNYAEMREDDLYYDGCFSRDGNTTIQNSIDTIYGFGRPLVSLILDVRPEIYLEGTPTNPALSSNTVIDTVLYTDNKDFAFLVQCWTGVNQRAWAVVSRTPNLDSNSIRIIESIALSLGFSRENFMFFKQDSCQFGHGNPILGLEN